MRIYKVVPKDRSYIKQRIGFTKSGCWEWKLHKNRNGYGLVRVGSYAQNTRGYSLAHRLAYTIFRGEFDKNLHVLHKCDNPPCVNPEHLFLGSQADNNADMRSKGRQRILKNEEHGRAKLNWEKVRVIRDRYASGEMAKYIAVDFGISVPTVYDVKNKRIWK